MPGSAGTAGRQVNNAEMWLRPGLIEPKKLACAYLSLAWDAASEITGQSITEDRGQIIAGEG